jgi:hypothetical protein
LIKNIDINVWWCFKPTSPRSAQKHDEKENKTRKR